MTDLQSNRVFVGNLSYEVRWQDLKDFMNEAGEVLRADVLQTGNGHSRGCGIVEFANIEGARNAIQTLQNQELKGRAVFIREDREPLNSAASASVQYSKGGIPNAVFVENLAYSTNWADLKDYFKSAGNVLRADVHMYQGRSKGRGTVVFEDAAGVDNAISTLNGTLLQGRLIRVRKDLPQEERPAVSATPITAPPSAQLVVNNLPWTTSNEQLAALVATCANVLTASVQYLPNGKSAGYGLVQTASVEDATAAIEQLNGYTFGERRLAVSYGN